MFPGNFYKQNNTLDVKQTWLTASPKATNANSPPGARRRPTRIADMIEMPNSLPTKATKIDLPPIRSAKVPLMTGKFERRSLGSMDIPTCKPTK